MESIQPNSDLKSFPLKRKKKKKKKTDLRVLFATTSSKMVTVKFALSHIIVIMTNEYWPKNNNKKKIRISVLHLMADRSATVLPNSISENL